MWFAQQLALAQPARAASAAAMVDVNTLIAEVQKRPALWDQAHPHRHNREVLEVLWEELGRLFCAPPDEIRKKWKGLRDTFRKELRKYPNGFDQDLSQDEYPPWVFFKPLYFLKGQMKARAAAAAGGNNGYHYLMGREDDDSEDLLERVEPSVQSALRDLGARGVKRPAADEMDEDHHFFLSLLPHVRKLSPLRKLQLRAKIQDLICQEVYPGEAEHDQPVVLDHLSGMPKAEPAELAERFPDA